MTDIIHLLPDSVANQIAAGEVIQRPASVIKELVENSIDAGATEIKIWVQDAGRTSIIVQDNGKGMTDTDARLSFERHATSKISAAADLYSLHTMGFRGEALASIAAVAEVELTTRTNDEELGVKLVLSGSKIENQEPIVCPVGATFKVQNLFFNVPARRKFLKSNQTELNNILTEFERIALAHPSIRFSVYSNKVMLFNLPAEKVKQRIVSLFGQKLGKQLISLDVNTSLSKISGFVGVPESARRRGAHQFFFVNDRYMRHPYFNKAVATVFEPILKQGYQIPYFIYFEVDPSRIDVNIHPTKTEIKFEDEQAIWQILAAAVRESLGKFEAVPSIDFTAGDGPTIPVYDPERKPSPMPQLVDSSYNPFKGDGGTGRHFSATVPPKDWDKLYQIADGGVYSGTRATEVPTQGDATLYSERPSAEKEDWEEKSLAHFQYKGRYIMTSVRSGLMIIDQQRAEERILFDRYMEMLGRKTGVSQRVLFPEIVHLSPSQVVIFASVKQELADVGFDFSDMDNGNFAVNAVPAGIEGVNVSSLLGEIVESARLNSNADIADKINRIIAGIMAHRASQNQGEVLTNEQMGALINDLFSCSEPTYTPDGKLVVAIVPNERIEQVFK